MARYSNLAEDPVTATTESVVTTNGEDILPGRATTRTNRRRPLETH